MSKYKGAVRKCVALAIAAILASVGLAGVAQAHNIEDPCGQTHISDDANDELWLLHNNLGADFDDRTVVLDDTCMTVTVVWDWAKNANDDDYLVEFQACLEGEPCESTGRISTDDGTGDLRTTHPMIVGDSHVHNGCTITWSNQDDLVRNDDECDAGLIISA